MTNTLFSRRLFLQILSAAAAAPMLPPGVALAAQSASEDPSEWTIAQVAEAFERMAIEKKPPEGLDRWLRDPKSQRIEPFRLFDNVWYVGVKWVSSYLIETSEGLVLIDTLHEPFVDILFDNLKKVGASLDDIRLVLMTHGHFDHVGGYYRLRPALKNARFVMSRKGWEEALVYARASKKSKTPWVMDEHVDVVGRDGEQFKVGDSVFTLLETPGHTWGTASYMYEVEREGRRYAAVSVGGQGLNAIESVEQLDAYISSMKRLGDPALGIEVDMTMHAFSSGHAELLPAVKNLKPGEHHPYINRKAYLARLEKMISGARSMKKSMMS